MIQARRLGHITLQTPDLPRQVAYFTEVIGLSLVAQEGDRAFLASQVGQLAVALERGPEARCTHLAFAVATETDFAAAARELSAEGIRTEPRADAAPGVGGSLLLTDPKGTSVELFSDWKPLPSGPGGGIGPIKLGHVAFQVTDVRRVADFYARVLGFRVSDWIDDWFVFMRCNPDHHTVNFVQGPVDWLHHMAFELKDWAQVQTTCDFLSRRDVDLIWGPLRHGPGHNISVYFRDADAQIVEAFCELDQMPDESLGYFEPRPWHRDRPQRPKVWHGRGSGTIWGPPPSEAMGVRGPARNASQNGGGR